MTSRGLEAQQEGSQGRSAGVVSLVEPALGQGQAFIELPALAVGPHGAHAIGGLTLGGQLELEQLPPEPDRLCEAALGQADFSQVADQALASRVKLEAGGQLLARGIDPQQSEQGQALEVVGVPVAGVFLEHRLELGQGGLVLAVDEVGPSEHLAGLAVIGIGRGQLPEDFHIAGDVRRMTDEELHQGGATD